MTGYPRKAGPFKAPEYDQVRYYKSTNPSSSSFLVTRQDIHAALAYAADVMRDEI